MTDGNTLVDNNIKGFGKYVLCDICAFDGYTNEKVVFIYTGFRSEDEDRFVYKYTVNEYENPDRIHIHTSLRGTSYLQKNTSADQSILNGRLKEQFDNESCDIWGDFIGDHTFRDA